MSLFHRDPSRDLVIQEYEHLLAQERAARADDAQRYNRELEAAHKRISELEQRLMVLTNPDALRRASAPPPRFMGVVSESPQFNPPDLPEFMEAPRRPVPPGWVNPMVGGIAGMAEKARRSAAEPPVEEPA